MVGIQLETSSTSATHKGTVVYFVTEDWYFCSHRLPLAIAARKAGYNIYVITRVDAHGDVIKSAGLNLIPIEFSRRSKNPFAEALVLVRLAKIYRTLKPAIVHHVALKPVIYGTIAAKIASVPQTINALAGLGYMFSSRAFMARVLRPLIRTIFRLLLNHGNSTLILQNTDDVELICGGGLVARERVKLIMGSGVDPEEFSMKAEAAGMPIVLLASRLLWDKGVGDFVKAAEHLRKQGAGARFVIVGAADTENPGAISDTQLADWKRQGYVELWGQRSDMPDILASCHIVCLPTSYGEGVPKILIEAASCGRPIVATDVPGCREIVEHGRNGLLVPVHSVDALVRAIGILLDSPKMRHDMGIDGRQIVKDKFSLAMVLQETLRLYGPATP